MGTTMTATTTITMTITTITTPATMGTTTTATSATGRPMTYEVGGRYFLHGPNYYVISPTTVK
jgi:hypothetical protein